MPPYRELARRAHFSATTLAEAAGGRRLPSLSVTLAFVRACGGDAQAWEPRWRALAADLASRGGQSPQEDADYKTCPYLGLAAYGPADADRFFGREVLTEQLVEAVRKQRFVGVFGASGCGKSSLLHAGLRAWAARPVPEGPLWQCVDFTPGPHPLQQCAAQFACLSGISAIGLFRDLKTSPEALHLSVLQILAASGPNSQLLIVVDQFEELFTLCSEEEEREAFIAALADVARAGESRARVVIGVRADFYAHCARYPALVELLQGAQFLVGPMTGEELRTAVSRPAAEAGCAVEAALQARVVADAARQPAALPLVSHAMREAWRRRRGNTLTLAGYEACGGIADALARTAETAFSGLPQRQQQVARRLLLRMVRLGTNAEDTKQRLDRRELDPDTAEVLTALVGARLLTVDTDSVQIAHEALLSAWPRLRSWIEEDRAGLLVRQRLTDAAAAWTDAGHDPGLLLRSGRLAVAAEWASGHRDDVLGTPALDRYLAASRRQASRAARARTLVIAALAVLSVLTATTAAVALQQRTTARAAQDHVVADELAVDGPELLGQDSSMAARAELASYRMYHDADIGADLLSTEHAPLARVFAVSSPTVYALAYNPNGSVLATSGGDDSDGSAPGPSGRGGQIRLWDATSFAQLAPPLASGRQIFDLAFSPDGKLLAGSGTEAGVQLWDVSDPRRPAAYDISATGLGTSRAASVSFSPDGRLLATANNDDTVGIWDISNPSHPRAVQRLSNGGQGVASVTFVHGGILAASGRDGTVRLWDVNTAGFSPLTKFRVDSDDSVAMQVTFSPDGAVMAAAGDDHAVQLWSLADRADPTPLGPPLTGHNGAVMAMTFSPDGRVLATAGADHTVRLWNTANPGAAIQLGQPLTGHTGAVDALAFRPGGHELASAGTDATARIWTLPGTVLVGHSAPVTALAFRPDGQVLASGGKDETVRLWDLADPWHPKALGDPLADRGGTVTNLVFRADGKVLAGGSQDGTIQLWDVSDFSHPLAIDMLRTGFVGAVTCLAFSPDGRILAASSEDGTVRLWNVSDPADPLAIASPLYRSTSSVHALAFTPDGRDLTSATDADTVRRWRMSDPANPVPLVSSRLAGAPDGILDLAFSPDGNTLAAAAQNAGIDLWDLTAWSSRKQAPQEPAPASGTGSVSTVAFSPDSRTLASGATDGTLRLWDTADPASTAPRGAAIAGHDGPVDAVAFSPEDRRVVATAGDDETVQITVLDPQAAGERICSLTAGAEDRQRWQQYLPDVPYKNPCR
ncbi:WD40 repeat protein [Catenulispora sp. EB89]|uniref:nSTAND1 domain-containing NTPase n=1 Tax=Catenulispora sp. EB89 TaxID=3156257 RepID=UPI00351233C8